MEVKSVKFLSAIAIFCHILMFVILAILGKMLQNHLFDGFLMQQRSAEKHWASLFQLPGSSWQHCGDML